MVMAKLHIICGNCGCNDMFEYEIVKYYDDDENVERERVSIACSNCDTIHDIDDNAKKL